MDSTQNVGRNGVSHIGNGFLWFIWTCNGCFLEILNISDQISPVYLVMALTGLFQPIMVLKNLDKMASLWFVLDFNGSFRLLIVDFA